MTTKIDWSLDSHRLKRRLLQLSKSKLIKLCKSKNVYTNGNKKELIDNLLNTTKAKTNRKKRKTKKQKIKNTKLKVPKESIKSGHLSQKPQIDSIDSKIANAQSDSIMYNNQHLSPIETIDSCDDEYTEYRMDATKRQLLVYGYVRMEFEEENYDIIFPLEIKKLLKLFVALFGWDIMKKGYLIQIDDLNDYKISTKKKNRRCYQGICFSEVLLSPYKYYFKLKIGSCKKDGIIVGIVKTAQYETYVNNHSKERSSKSFSLCSSGMILERRCKKNQTKQWKKNDILDVFVDMNELEMSFKLNDLPAKNIIDTVGNEYYFFVSLQYNNSIELINYAVKGEIHENDSTYSNDDWLFDDDNNDNNESSSSV